MQYQIEILNPGQFTPRLPAKGDQWYTDLPLACHVADVLDTILGAEIGPIIVTREYDGREVYRAGPPVEKEFPGGEFAPEEAEHVW